jgi:hypothetical protein
MTLSICHATALTSTPFRPQNQGREDKQTLQKAGSLACEFHVNKAILPGQINVAETTIGQDHIVHREFVGNAYYNEVGRDHCNEPKR